MAPITVPMKNGVSSEENAKVAPSARCRLSRLTSLRNANPAPRSTIPASASHSGSAAAVITAANACGNAVQKMTRAKTSQTWLASHTGVIDSSIRAARRAAAPVAAGQQVPQAAAEVGPAQDRVQGDRGQQDGPDRGRDHRPRLRPAAWSCGSGGGP